MVNHTLQAIALNARSATQAPPMHEEHPVRCARCLLAEAAFAEAKASGLGTGGVNPLWSRLSQTRQPRSLMRRVLYVLLRKTPLLTQSHRINGSSLEYSSFFPFTHHHLRPAGIRKFLPSFSSSCHLYRRSHPIHVISLSRLPYGIHQPRQYQI